MKVNTELQKEILEVVNNQLKANDPKETKITLAHLIGEGYSKSMLKNLLTSVFLECIVW